MLLEIRELTAKTEADVRPIHWAIGDGQTFEATVDLLAGCLDGFVVAVDRANVISSRDYPGCAFSRVFLVRELPKGALAGREPVEVAIPKPVNRDANDLFAGDMRVRIVRDAYDDSYSWFILDKHGAVFIRSEIVKPGDGVHALMKVLLNVESGPPRTHGELQWPS